VSDLSAWKIYTPEGVQDILEKECFVKRKIESSLRNLFGKWGYNEIETPALEFYDTFYADSELTPQENMFKLFDHKGRILVLRTENTIPVVRLAVTKYKDVLYPLRFSYIGNMFRFNEHGGGRQKEFTQAGVELLGSNTPEADAEVIVLAINTLKKAGLENFQVDIGQVGFFKGIMEEVGLSEEDTERMKKLMEKKDYIGMEELANGHGLSSDMKKIVLGITNLFGTPDIIKKAEKLTSNNDARNALKYLREVMNIIDDYGLSRYISVDLGMVQNLDYYTGIIFRGFTYGVGFPVLSGGRYNSLAGKFGRDCPATGFSMGINMVMMAIDRQKIKTEWPLIDTLILYDTQGRKTAFKISEILRKQGLKVEMDTTCNDIEYLKKYAKNKGIGGLLNIVDEQKIEVHDLESGNIENTDMDTLLNSQ